MLAMISRLRNRIDGNVALIFALLAPMLLAAAGLAIDFQARLSQKQSLQDAADTLAIRGARELLLENSNSSAVEALIDATARRQFFEAIGAFDISAAVDNRAKKAIVTLAQPSKESFFFARFIPREDPIIVTANAQARGVSNVCVIALDAAADSTILLATASKLNAPKCAILSNSKSTTGIRSESLSQVRARLICSAGGIFGSPLNYDPQPLTDCPVYPDPLSEHTSPDIGVCDHSNLTVGTSPNLTGSLLSLLENLVASIDGSFAGTLTNYQRYDFDPGVYCGGLTISDKSDVHFAPGIYVMKDGPLHIEMGARLYGENVGFYLNGDDSVVNFEPASIIHLTAPKTGLMAGILFQEAKGAPLNRTHRIASANARELLGTIYLPNGVLEISSTQPIADQSAYTAIVAHRFRMLGTPTLVLNTNYAATDIPTPDGIGPTGGQVFLRE